MNNIKLTVEYMDEVLDEEFIDYYIKWYKKIISSRVKYIIFANNKSYYLFLLLHKKINGNIDDKVLLTTSSMKNYCGIFAK